jgi:SHS family lactate transporter-like MFS transporter
MVNLALFAIAEICTGLATSYLMLLIVRALFGIVMGGQWGVGASLVMDKAPVKKRGMLSGLLQEGYAAGNVLAAVSFFSLYGRLGWRPLFFVGTLPALALLLFIAFKVEESEVWTKAKPQTWSQQSREIVSHWRLFLYLLAFMTMMLFASHGTQDMYPTFLQRQWHFPAERRAIIIGIAGIGAIIGGIVGGHLSDKLGRRRIIMIAFACGILLIPLWAFAPNQFALVAGAFFMQFMVQAAWGVIPAHLAELAPNSVRAFLPGFAYQMAGVLASSSVYIEASYAQHASYGSAMALTAATVFVLASLFAFLGKEQRGLDFDPSAVRGAIRPQSAGR